MSPRLHPRPPVTGWRRTGSTAPTRTGSWTPAGLASATSPSAPAQTATAPCSPTVGGPFPGAPTAARPRRPTSPPARRCGASCSPAVPPQPTQVTKLMVIMEENETTSAYDGMPYLRSLSDTYGKAINYSGLDASQRRELHRDRLRSGRRHLRPEQPVAVRVPAAGGDGFGQASRPEDRKVVCRVDADELPQDQRVPVRRTTQSVALLHRRDHLVQRPRRPDRARPRQVPLRPTSRRDVPARVDGDPQPEQRRARRIVHAGRRLAGRWIPAIMAGSDYQAGPAGDRGHVRRRHRREPEHPVRGRAPVIQRRRSSRRRTTTTGSPGCTTTCSGCRR